MEEPFVKDTFPVLSDTFFANPDVKKLNVVFSKYKLKVNVFHLHMT